MVCVPRVAADRFEQIRQAVAEHIGGAAGVTSFQRRQHLVRRTVLRALVSSDAVTAVKANGAGLHEAQGRPIR